MPIRPGGAPWRAVAVLTALAFCGGPVFPQARVYDDHALAGAAEARLQREMDLRALPVRVEVKGGVAILRGRVDTLAQVETARRAVAQVRGLVELDATELVVPADSGLGDGRLRSALEDALALVPSLRSQALDIQVDQGVARLEGSVGTAVQRRLLLDKAREVRGLRGVVLQVTPREGSGDEDARVEEQVRGLLADRVRFPLQGRVTAKVRDHTAILEGTVQRVIDRLDAEQVAWYVGGVRGVQNLIQVVPRPRLRRARQAGGEEAAPPAPREPQGDPETPEPAQTKEDDTHEPS